VRRELEEGWLGPLTSLGEQQISSRRHLTNRARFGIGERRGERRHLTNRARFGVGERLGERRMQMVG